MKKSTWRNKRTFGPVVEHLMPEGTFRAICTWCAFRVGNGCTYVKPPRYISDPENTPEWCPLREDMIQAAKDASKKRQ